MHPVSTVLFLVGYALALPVAFRWASVLERRSTLALTGHQLGIGVAMIGWFLRGRVYVAVAHLIWMIAAKIWFDVATRDDANPSPGRTPRA